MATSNADIIAEFAQEKRTWPGWCTLESEPALFNELLQNFGVKDAQVEEVYSLDEDSLSAIKPVYGLIFLFRWKSELAGDDYEYSCPEGVWFANQVTDNLCASLAMLNIVMNRPEVELGDNLESFKEYSKDLPPPLRGLAMANFEYLRQCHNAFARKSEMMDSDLNLMEAVKSKAKGTEESDEEVFHFIAYVPIDGYLWELDGLKRQPVKHGQCTAENWLSLATPKIQERIERYSKDEIRFTLLAVVRKPLKTHREQLVANTKLLHLLERRLDALDAKWRDSISDSVWSANDSCTETSTSDDTDSLPVDEVKLIESETKISPLLSKREALIKQWESLKSRVRDEEEKLEAYKLYATRKQHDYSAFISKMAGFLADKAVVQHYIQ